MTPVNDPPGALTLKDQTATTETLFSYQVPEATDPDGDDLTYAAFLGTGQNPLPGWLSFDEETRTFSGTPQRVHAGEYEIQVTVTDSKAAAKKAEFTLTVVLPPNGAPEVPDLTSQTATEDQAFSYVVPEFDDPEGDTVTYAAALDGGGTLPGWLGFNATSRTLSGTPQEDDTPGVLTIVVTATDDGDPPASAEVRFTLDVVEVNDAPTASAGEDQTVPAASFVTSGRLRKPGPGGRVADLRLESGRRTECGDFGCSTAGSDLCGTRAAAPGRGACVHARRDRRSGSILRAGLGEHSSRWFREPGGACRARDFDRGRDRVGGGGAGGQFPDRGRAFA